MKRIIAFVLAALMLVSFAAAEGAVRVAALNGPTGMGMVKLMSDEEGGDSYSFELAASADLITPGLVKGDIDIACVPANLASVLYNRTEGGVTVLAVNTLGVMYIVENAETISSISDLKGRVICSAGKGSTPEYALRFLLQMNGIDPDNDVTIDWKSEHAECLTALMTGENVVAMLPQPFVTVAQTKSADIRVALDLTQEWNALETGSSMITGVVIARTAFVNENPDKVNEFLNAYAESVAWVNGNVAEAAQLIGSYGIVAAAVAEKALPYCNIVCISGSEMADMLPGYLEVLFEQNPAAVGGKLPENEFYYAAR